MVEELFRNENRCRFLDAAGARKMVAFDEASPCNLLCVSFLTNSLQQIALVDTQLEKDVLISFFVLCQNLHLCPIDVGKRSSAVRWGGCKQLVQHLLDIPCRPAEAPIDRAHHVFRQMFAALRKTRLPEHRDGSGRVNCLHLSSPSVPLAVFVVITSGHEAVSHRWENRSRPLM